jgi:hypothetical protein
MPPAHFSSLLLHYISLAIDRIDKTSFSLAKNVVFEMLNHLIGWLQGNHDP